MVSNQNLTTIIIITCHKSQLNICNNQRELINILLQDKGT